MANGEIEEQGTGFYVLSAERVGRAQWFVENYPGYPACNPQTGKFAWPFAPSEDSLKQSDRPSTASSLHEIKLKEDNKIENDDQLDTCKEMMKIADDEMV